MVQRAGGAGFAIDRRPAQLGRAVAVIAYLALTVLYARYGLAYFAASLASLARRHPLGYGFAAVALVAGQAIALEQLLAALFELAG
ncbi:MAG: hypothetical protein ACYCWW_10980 [Deltaproteobacteria bacterium]